MPKRKFSTSYSLADYAAKRRRAIASVNPLSRPGRALARSAAAIRSMVVPGYTRTGGYYGRYNRTPADGEVKFFDTGVSFTFDATGEVPANGQLSLIPQGDTESTRDGRKAVIKSIQLRGNLIYAPGAGATAATTVYLYIILDTQCNGAAAAVTDVFTSSAMGTNFINLANSGRFRIIKKLSYTFNPSAGATTAYNDEIRKVEYFKRCNIPMQWSSTTGAITEIRSNNIFLMAGSTNSDDAVTASLNARLRFVG